MPQLAHPRPQNEEDTLPCHTVDLQRTRSNTGSLRTPIQAPTSVYISNTVHMETMMNAIHLQLADLLTDLITASPLPPFLFYTATQPRITLNLSPEVCGTQYYRGEPKLS